MVFLWLIMQQSILSIVTEILAAMAASTGLGMMV